MEGLAGALDTLHNQPGGVRLNCRHGDLKPANIVRAISSQRGSSNLGILQITDMGLTKINDQYTNNRMTSGTYKITERYQSPEFKFRASPETPTSRSYDMWSIGCIMLEFIIWLLYGGGQLNAFNGFCKPFFFDETSQKCKLQPTVDHWISHMNRTILSKPGHPVLEALHEILELVHQHLLVEDSSWREGVDAAAESDFKVLTLRPNGEKATSKRMSSDDLHSKMTKIRVNMNKPTTNASDPQPSWAQPEPPPPHTSSGGTSRLDTNPPMRMNTQTEYSVEPMPDFWDSYPDNELALRVFPNISMAPLELPGPALGLCSRCSGGDRAEGRGIFSSNFIFEVGPSVDRMCGVCSTLANNGRESFVRRGSYLTTHSTHPPEYSIIVGPGISAAPNDLQRSLPNMPPFMLNKKINEDGFAVLKQWLKDCDDETHGCHSKPSEKDALSSIPTRLISVGKTHADTIRLVETKEWVGAEKKPEEIPNDIRYVALSHRWKYVSDKSPFRLTTNTRTGWVQTIPLGDMPQNFRDAVMVTRTLGIPYLWIDSLCIIQDEEDDWLEEAKRMQQVYNGAYCTVAATSASDTNAGFLHRNEVPCTKIRAQVPGNREAEFYLRRAIDNFHDEVEKAELNQRGWVFQERALSRRILHFAKSQVYMECGGGIWCESTSRLFNRKSHFFSDANFPHQALEFHAGMKIRYYETIYMEYSRRGFTKDYDRAIALQALEDKMLKTYGTTGRFGILELLVYGDSRFHRSLMWQRDGEKPMCRISSESDKMAPKIMNPVPTWSWMKSIGPIKYFPIDMGITNWSEDGELKSPFKAFQSTPGLADIGSSQHLVISAIALKIDKKAYHTTGAQAENVFELDSAQSPAEVKGLQCVVVGKRKINPAKPLSYVLLVAPAPNGQTRNEYERVGVGSIEERYILQEKKRDITIV